VGSNPTLHPRLLISGVEMPSTVRPDPRMEYLRGFLESLEEELNKPCYEYGRPLVYTRLEKRKIAISGNHL
jgi:hypothetical protein